MVRLKVSRIGDSLGVVLPDDVLELLEVGEGDTVEIVGSVASRAVSDISVDRLMQMAERIMDENREALRALARCRRRSPTLSAV